MSNSIPALKPSQNLNILSSQDTNNTKSSTQHKNLNVSYTLYGTNSSNLFALAWRFEPTMVVVLLVLMLMLLAIRLEAIDWVCWAWS
jgi:hypothetical protein